MWNDKYYIYFNLYINTSYPGGVADDGYLPLAKTLAAKSVLSTALFPKVDSYIFIYTLISSTHPNKYKNVE